MLLKPLANAGCVEPFPTVAVVEMELSWSPERLRDLIPLYTTGFLEFDALDSALSLPGVGGNRTGRRSASPSSDSELDGLELSVKPDFKSEAGAGGAAVWSVCEFDRNSLVACCSGASKPAPSSP